MPACTWPEVLGILSGEALLKPSCFWKDFSCGVSDVETQRKETIPEISVGMIDFHVHIDNGLGIDVTSGRKMESDFSFLQGFHRVTLQETALGAGKILH